MVPIYKPYLPAGILDHAHNAIDSTWISSAGKYKTLAEEKLAEFLNVSPNNLFLCSNGTTATHLCAIAIKHKYPNINRILVPNNVYVAAWNAFLINPVFKIIPVKTNIQTWNIDLEDLEKKIKPNDAVLIVHNVGGIINVPKLKRKYQNTVFIEDNCEGFSGTYENLHSGTASFCSSVSFFANKTITSGEGGLFYCKDSEVTKHIKKVHGQGVTSEKYVHDVLGYNYRMTNIQAALLLGQLEYYDEIIQRKKNIWSMYTKFFSRYPEIFSFQSQAPECINAKWIFALRIKNSLAEELINLLAKAGIESRPMFYPMSKHNHLKKFSLPREENESNILNKETIMLPSHPGLSVSEINFITKTILGLVR